MARWIRRTAVVAVLMMVGCGGAVTAWGAPLAAGTWETTAEVQTPQGLRTIKETVCQRGGQLDSVLMRQQGAACAPWVAGRPNAAGEQLFTAQCTQSGVVPGLVMPFVAEARVKVAPNGQRVTGTVVATGTVNGLALSSPPTPFTARFLRPSCTGR